MQIEEIVSTHHHSHQAFTDYIDRLSETDYSYSHLNEKWNAGQQLDHIARSVGALMKATQFPKFALMLKFGKANRPSRSSEEVIDKYTKGLAGGFKAIPPFIPDEVAFKDRKQHIAKIMEDSGRIEKGILDYSEKDMDTVILKHPAMGIMTMREMMYFAIHHVNHHLDLTKKYLRLREEMDMA